MTKEGIGLGLGLLSYLLWGFLSLFWKLLGGIDSYAVFSYRIVWTCLTMICYMLFTKQSQRFCKELVTCIKQQQLRWRMLGASFFIALNWLVYIFAVSHAQATEASLGYYLMPLVSILLSLLVLKERLQGVTIFAILLAGLGILVLLFQTGYLPIVSLILSVSFAMYGLLKKEVSLSSDVCMLIESAVVLPFATVYLLFFAKTSMADYIVSENLMLMLSGLVTAIPLLLFAEALKRAPLSQISFLQYLNPTIQLMLALTVFGESIDHEQLPGFVLIWLAIAIFIIGQWLYLKRMKQRL
ncbi:EamA family transporter RarD [Streptococcus pneumoniae]